VFSVKCLGFRVQGLRLRFYCLGLGCGVWDLRFKIQGLRLRV
jgi:hypothetical protein